MDIKVGVGMSQARDSRTAGREAAQRAKDQLGQSQPVFVVMTAAVTFDQQIVLEGAAAILAVPMVGGSVSGEICSQGVTQYSVVVMAFAGTGIKFQPVIQENLWGNPVEKSGGELGNKLKAGLANDAGLTQTALMWVDGLKGDVKHLLTETTKALGNQVDLFGMVTADQEEFRNSFQYYNWRAYSGAAVGALMSGEFVTATGHCTGWQSVGNQLTCTHNDGPMILELDDKPALETYRQYLGGERGLGLPLISWQYPWGMIFESPVAPNPLDARKVITKTATQDGENNKEEWQLRPVIGIDEAKQGLRFMAEIPKGTEMTITAASRNDLIQAAGGLAEKLKEKLLGAKLLFVINFSGLGRRLVLGSRIDEEWQMITAQIGKETPIFGGFGFGEIGSEIAPDGSKTPAEFAQQTCRLLLVGTHEY